MQQFLDCLDFLLGALGLPVSVFFAGWWLGGRVVLAMLGLYVLNFLVVFAGIAVFAIRDPWLLYVLESKVLLPCEAPSSAEEDRLHGPFSQDLDLCLQGGPLPVRPSPAESRRGTEDGFFPGRQQSRGPSTGE